VKGKEKHVNQSAIRCMWNDFRASDRGNKNVQCIS